MLNSEVQWALNLRLAWKNETMRMVSIFQKISKYETTTARAHSLTIYAPTRLNRYPHISSVWVSETISWASIGRATSLVGDAALLTPLHPAGCAPQTRQKALHAGLLRRLFQDPEN